MQDLKLSEDSWSLGHWISKWKEKKVIVKILEMGHLVIRTRVWQGKRLSEVRRSRCWVGHADNIQDCVDEEGGRRQLSQVLILKVSRGQGISEMTATTGPVVLELHKL